MFTTHPPFSVNRNHGRFFSPLLCLLASELQPAINGLMQLLPSVQSCFACWSGLQIEWLLPNSSSTVTCLTHCTPSVKLNESTPCVTGSRFGRRSFIPTFCSMNAVKAICPTTCTCFQEDLLLETISGIAFCSYLIN